MCLDTEGNHYARVETWPFDLDWLDREVADRESSWRESGATWTVARGPLTDKPAAQLNVETPQCLGELIVWVSGEAEMMWGPTASATERIHQEHYDLSGSEGLRSCLDDLEHRIGLPDQWVPLVVSVSTCESTGLRRSSHRS